jgi:hypothetical protein
MNALKSGIYAKSEIIPGEDPAELETLKSQYYASLQPEGYETDLVDQAIRAGWQLRRLARAEADIWNMSMSGDMENNRKKGLPENKDLYLNAIQDNAGNFDRIYRYQASVARILNRSLETLLRLRKNGDLLQPAEQNEPNSPAVEIAETNPIPEPVAPSAPRSAAETKPIPSAPLSTTEGPSAEGRRPEGPTPSLQPPIPSPQRAPRPGFRYYNGHRIPITENPKS